MITIRDHIRKHRLDLDLLQKEVAEKIGADKTTVFNWETGRVKPQLKHMPGIISFLGYSPLCESGNTAQRLLNHRKAAGLTQEQFAGVLGVDPSTLARWERGERIPRGVHLLTLKEKTGLGASVTEKNS